MLILWSDNLKTFSVFAVILLHVAAGFVGGIGISDPMYGGYSWWAGNIYDSITRWSVPLFIIISGFYLLNKNEPIKIFFNKRLKKILIPLLFWSSFFSLWIILKSFFKGDISIGLITVAKDWVLGAPYYHLWYLFMIPFLYLVTPVLRLIFNSASRNELLAFICFCFVLSMLSTAVSNVLSYFDLNAKVNLFTNNFLSYLGYFCFGGYVAKYNLTIKTNRCFMLLCVSWCVTILGSYFFTLSYFYSYLSINTVFASVAIFFLMKNLLDREIGLSRFAGLSFGIYLIHPIFLDITSALTKSWLPDKLNVYVYIPLVALVVFVLSYQTVFVMSKIKFFKKCV